MTIRNFDRLFRPRSVALVGASRKAGTVGHVLARNLFHAGFQGPILPVHPEREAVEGVLAYPSVAELPRTPDLAIIATPPAPVPGLVAELAERGTRAAVVITAGFGEGDHQEGRELRDAMLEAARPHLMRIVGPNCVGIMVPGIGLNASFSHIAPRTGDLAFVTQSGAMVTAMLDWATPRGIGFSHVVSLGDMADVDFGDVIDYLASDPGTRAILLYVEQITDARKLMSAARAASRSTPVIVIKGGRFAEGARAVSSHTGAMAGSDAVYDAAFRRAGMLRVWSLPELFDAAQTLATTPKLRGDRLAILTNGGGLGVLATDALIEEGGKLAELSDKTMETLNAALPPTWSHGNPVDIIGDAHGPRYAAALEALLDDRGADAVLVLNCPTAVASSTEAAEAVTEVVGRRRGRPVFTSWLGQHAAEQGRAILAEHDVPSYFAPEQAVRGFMHLVRYRRSQEALMQTPPAIADHHEPDVARARQIVHEALEAGCEWLDEAQAKEVLAAYGIPVVPTRIAEDPDAAGAIASDIGFPVALKILSPDLTHKSEVGGVVLELEDATAVRDAAERMLRRVRKSRPDAQVTGFTVQQMARRPGAVELILGATVDPQFGPVLLFGRGGTAVEVIRDQAIGLPPLDMKLARFVMERTRVWRRLQGYRDTPQAAIDDIARALVDLSSLVTDLSEVAEVDVNPLLADAHGVVALDAAIKICRSDLAGPERLAIRPYPKELEQQLVLRDGTELVVRPIRPEDEPALQELLRRMDPEDVRMRFFVPMRELEHSFAARLTQIDYDRAMALVAFGPNDREQSEILGVVRIASDPDGRSAEYAIIVRSDMKGHGLGYALMQKIVDYAKSRGIAEIVGDVLRENHPMLRLCEELGFQSEAVRGEPDLVRVRKPLR